MCITETKDNYLSRGFELSLSGELNSRGTEWDKKKRTINSVILILSTLGEVLGSQAGIISFYALYMYYVHSNKKCTKENIFEDIA